MHPPGAETVLLRYGEIGVKSAQLRKQMEERLQENILAVFEDRGIDATVSREHTRLYAHSSSADIEAVTDAVTDVFGVVSASPARRVEPTMAAICSTVRETASQWYGGEPFAVRANRAGAKDAHPFTSTDLERQAGTAVFETAENAGMEPTVDLEEPQTVFGIECREADAYVFLGRQDGPGGLPLGTQEPLVALISGGIDSPVAAWLAMKRGAPVYPLYVDLGSYGGIDHRARVVETVETLRRYGPNQDLRLRVAPGGTGIERIAEELGMYRMVAVRRFMLRIASKVAADLGACGIVTGESIGQKSSQTTANLAVTAAVTDVPVHRPLLTMDKTEITAQAKSIGTYEDATIDTGCHQLAPDNPATQPPQTVVAEAEPGGIDRLAADAAAERTILDDEL